jgi:hypothetical protein
MNRRRMLVLSALLITLLVGVPIVGADPAGAWVTSTTLPSEMVRADAEYYNGHMYILGFRLGVAGTTDGSIWDYNVATDTWTDTGVDMPTPVSNYSIAMLTDATGVGLYVFGGRDSTGACTTAVQVYYPATNTTATVATDPWGGTLNGAVVFPGAVEAVGNKAYAWGGYCGGTTDPWVSSQTWIFDPSAAAGSRWTAGPALPSGGAYQASAVADGMVYSIGGDIYDGSVLIAYDTVLMLDPANLGSGWQAKAALPVPSSLVPGCDESRAFGFDTASGWLLAGRIVLAGCGQWDQTPNVLADSFLYNVATNTWSTFPALNITRRNHAGAFVQTSATSGFMWVGGGYDGSGTNVGTDTTETYAVGAPTSVSLVGIDSHSDAGVPLWALAAAGLVLLASGVGVARARALR